MTAPRFDGQRVWAEPQLAADRAARHRRIFAATAIAAAILASLIVVLL